MTGLMPLHIRGTTILERAKVKWAHKNDSIAFPLGVFNLDVFLGVRDAFAAGRDIAVQEIARTLLTMLR